MANIYEQENLRKLKATDDFFNARHYAKYIREAVDKGATNLDELGVTDDDIDRFILEAQEREAIKRLRKLKATDDLFNAKHNAKYIRKAVSEGATGWDKLSVTDSDISKFVLEAQEREKRK